MAEQEDAELTSLMNTSRIHLVGRHGVRISPQLGHLPVAGGGPQRPRRREEHLSDWVGHGGSEGGGEVEAGQDQCP